MKQELLILLHVLLMLYTKCIMSSQVAIFSLFSDVSEYICPIEYILFEKKVSKVACMILCGSDGSCEGVDYNAETEVCRGCKGLIGADCTYNMTTPHNATGIRMYTEDTKSFLVSGILAIPDDHILASSIRSGWPSKYSRYCLPTNAWIPNVAGTNQWIEAQFWQLANVRGIYVQAWGNGAYVTSFKLTHSADCTEFQYYNTTSSEHMFCLMLSSDISWETSFQDVSNEMSHDRIGQEWNEIFQAVEFTCKIRIFQGVQADLAPVTTVLPSPVSALCTRIRPMTWVGNDIIFRFDVIGRYP